MSRPLFDRSPLASRDFDTAFESIFGARPRTVREAEADESDDDLVPADMPAVPVSQQDGE